MVGADGAREKSPASTTRLRLGTEGRYVRGLPKKKVTAVGMISVRGSKVVNSSPMTILDLSRED
jgi:hypothetical protein